jgi:hypothetical protein
MKSPSLKVQCSVDNCLYNKSQACYASQLMVRTMGDGVANSADGTCCATFEPRSDEI